MLITREARCFRARELNKPGFPKSFLSSQSLVLTELPKYLLVGKSSAFKKSDFGGTGEVA